MKFSEDFLCYIWRFRLFNTLHVHCDGGERLEIVNPGILNRDAGPDFCNAKIRIGEMLWAGNVEVHLRSSDWIQHGHPGDQAYDSIILHVVYHHDAIVFRSNGAQIPVLVLKGLFDESLHLNYTALVRNMNKIPCERQLATISEITIKGFLPGISIERLDQKSNEVLQVLELLRGNWDACFYRFLSKNFGFKVNALPFELLAASLPQHILAKHKDNLLHIEALIFGQAGFLQQDFEQEYPRALKGEYNFLSAKYGLKSIDESLWKFLRMRPRSFPTIRLAQLSALMAKNSHLFAQVLATDNLAGLYGLFTGVPVNPYWRDHYHFQRPGVQLSTQMGHESVQNILINTVCLFLFAYGRYTQQLPYMDRALDFLENLPAEKNAVIGHYSGLGLRVDSAFLSQALLQLNKCYCSQKKCLNCGIGIKILNR